MSQTNEIARVVLAHPGLDAAEIMDRAKGVELDSSCAAILKYLTDKGTISRARIDGRFCYWPPGEAPETVAEPVKEKGWPGVNIDRSHKARNPAEDARAPKVDAPARPAELPVKTYPLSAVTGPARAINTLPITTPDWMLYPIEDGLIVMHKDTDTGFRLDAETVAAIQGIQW